MFLLFIEIMYCRSNVILSIQWDMYSLDIKCSRSLRHSQTVSPYYQWPRRSVHLRENDTNGDIKEGRHEYDLRNKSFPPVIIRKSSSLTGHVSP